MDYYPWLKAAHVIVMVAWMVGLLYLPRLFVYHAAAPVGSTEDATFKVMERRLLKGILNPAIILVWATGFWLAFASGYIKGAGWLHVKIGLVIVLSAYHGFLAATTKRFAADRNRRSPVFFRFVNEIPTVLMIAIVILVVVKPF